MSRIRVKVVVIRESRPFLRDVERAYVDWFRVDLDSDLPAGTYELVHECVGKEPEPETQRAPAIDLDEECPCNVGISRRQCTFHGGKP